MYDKTTLDQAHKLLDSVKESDIGIVVAILSEDKTMNMAAQTSEQFSIALITVLTQSILEQNMCCRAHFMATAMAIHETLTRIVTQKLEEIDESGSEVKH